MCTYFFGLILYSLKGNFISAYKISLGVYVQRSRWSRRCLLWAEPEREITAEKLRMSTRRVSCNLSTPVLSVFATSTVDVASHRRTGAVYRGKSSSSSSSSSSCYNYLRRRLASEGIVRDARRHAVTLCVYAALVSAVKVMCCIHRA